MLEYRKPEAIIMNIYFWLIVSILSTYFMFTVILVMALQNRHDCGVNLRYEEVKITLFECLMTFGLVCVDTKMQFN